MSYYLNRKKPLIFIPRKKKPEAKEGAGNFMIEWYGSVDTNLISSTGTKVWAIFNTLEPFKHPPYSAPAAGYPEFIYNGEKVYETMQPDAPDYILKCTAPNFNDIGYQIAGNFKERIGHMNWTISLPNDPNTSLGSIPALFNRFYFYNENTDGVLYKLLTSGGWTALGGQVYIAWSNATTFNYGKILVDSQLDTISNAMDSEFDASTDGGTLLATSFVSANDDFVLKFSGQNSMQTMTI